MGLLKRNDWIQMFQARAGLNESKAEKVTDALIEAMQESLRAENKVGIPKIGVISRTYRPARIQYVGNLGRFCELDPAYLYSFRTSHPLKKIGKEDARTGA